MGHSQADKAKSRQRILDSAAVQIRELGLHGLSIAELMKSAKLTHGGFYGHFGSREQLISEALAKALSEGGPETIRLGNPKGPRTLKGLLNTYLSKAHRDDPSVGCAVAALAFVLVAGSGLFVMIFGHGYRGVAPVLAMLLVGAIGESVGGPVDEVLKYQGQARPVLIGLIVTVAGEVLLARLLAPYGAVAAAAAQAIAFGAMYTFQIALCWRRLGILIVPYVRPRDLRAALAT